MTASTPNPFIVQKFFGQWIITKSHAPGGRLQIACNILYIVIFLGMLIYSMSTENAFIGGRYNFISSMRFYIQTFICSMLYIQISVTATLFRKSYSKSLQLLIDNDAKLQLIGIETHYNLKPKIAIYVILFLSAFAMFTFDVYTFGGKFAWTYFICQYLPSLGISVYVISVAMLMEICGDKFDAINLFLQKFTKNNDSLIEKYYLNKRREVPDTLLDVFPNHQNTIFQVIFSIFDEYIDNIRTINALSGYNLLIFLIIVTIDVLSFMYDICMDLGQYVKGYKLPPRSIYAIEYWSVLSIFGLVILLNASTAVMSTANRTKIYLHQLRNLYPKLDKYAEAFSLQLLHSTLNISAARFLTIHWGIIYKLVSTWITYIIVFMQLDTDISTMGPDDNAGQGGQKTR